MQPSFFRKATTKLAAIEPAEVRTHVAIIGAGLSGISTAYYLVRNHGVQDVVLLDALPQPMAFTSAQSGENYRNWWPHPTMKALADRSIHLLEEISHESDNRIRMTRRGYLLATRSNQRAEELLASIAQTSDDELRVHSGTTTSTAKEYVYQPPHGSDWQTAPAGVDILQGSDTIGKFYPNLDPQTTTIAHIRRAGDISGQQLGSYMLERIRQATDDRSSPLLVNTKVTAIERNTVDDTFRLEVATTKPSSAAAATTTTSGVVIADKIVNAAGPFAGQIMSSHFGVELPIQNIFHQKIAFEDTLKAISRTMPFMIDLDEQELNWSEEEKELLQADEELAWMTKAMPGCVHCRPDGGDRGTWVKLGWAFNTTPSSPNFAGHVQCLNDSFPEIVLRGAARLNPALGAYWDGSSGGLRRNRMHHYGGYYCMTDENWPIVGRLHGQENVFLNCAPSGFGTMTACATGELCASAVAGDAPLEEAQQSLASILSIERYDNSTLMNELRLLEKGVL